MSPLLLWTATLLGCLVVAIVCVRIFRKQPVNPSIGWLLVVAIILIAIPAAKAMLVTWKDQIVRTVEGRSEQKIAAQNADVSAELYDLTPQKGKKPADFADNRQFQVLIFYRHVGDAAVANKLKGALLAAGYRASAFQSEFTGWGADRIPSGEVLVVTRAKSEIARLKTAIEGSAPERKNRIRADVDRLVEGDYHIRFY